MLTIKHVIRTTEIDTVKKLIEAIMRVKDKVEECDISKETAYTLIMRGFDEFQKEIQERVGSEVEDETSI